LAVSFKIRDMKRELRDALDEVMEAFDHGLPSYEVKELAEDKMAKAFIIIDEIESAVNDCIVDIDESASDRKWELELISDKLY